jgi:hypothetical protein
MLVESDLGGSVAGVSGELAGVANGGGRSRSVRSETGGRRSIQAPAPAIAARTVSPP